MATTLTSPRGLELATFLPTVLYAGSVVGQAFFAAEGTEIDALRYGIGSALNQYFVDTADWALSSLEADYGLPTDATLTDPQRRQRLRAISRGTGTATIGVVERVAAAYLTQSEVPTVLEDTPSYAVTIAFFGPGYGPPAQDVALRAAVRAVVPANLTIAYQYNYLTWDQLKGCGLTWDQLKAIGLTWDQLKITSPTLLIAGAIAPKAPPERMTWDKLKARGYTWAQLKAKGLSWEQLASRDPSSL